MQSVAGGAGSSERSGYAKSLGTRTRILAAALAEASDAGLHKASVARIAARAGVAIGNLHYHFGSREGLLRELLASLVADLMARLHEVDADDGADFFERQRAGLLVYLEYLRANPAYVRLADEIKLYDPDLYRRAVAGWVERMAARIRGGIEQGSLRPMTESEITAQAHFLIGARHFLEQMREGGDGLGDEAVVDAYLALLRDGLGRQPAGRRVNARRPGKSAGPRSSGTRATDPVTSSSRSTRALPKRCPSGGTRSVVSGSALVKRASYGPDGAGSSRSPGARRGPGARRSRSKKGR